MMREIGFFMSLAPLLVNGHGSAHGSSASFSELITAKSVVAAVYFIVLFACTLVPTLRCTRSKFVKPILYGQVFGAGVFLATSLVHLLPAAQSSIKLVAPDIEYPLAHTFALMGFFGAASIHALKVRILTVYLLCISTLVISFVIIRSRRNLGVLKMSRRRGWCLLPLPTPFTQQWKVLLSERSPLSATPYHWRYP